MMGAMIRTCSHVVIATADVPRMERFFTGIFGVEAHYSNDQFCDIVLPSGFRVAFFTVVGAASRYFRADGDRAAVSLGVTVEDVDEVHRRVQAWKESPVEVSGPPKDHPWGERSFLLIDPDGNRWEITQSPSPSGMLVNR